jgi:hypothetical protein
MTALAYYHQGYHGLDTLADLHSDSGGQNTVLRWTLTLFVAMQLRDSLGSIASQLGVWAVLCAPRRIVPQAVLLGADRATSAFHRTSQLPANEFLRDMDKCMIDIVESLRHPLNPCNGTSCCSSLR